MERINSILLSTVLLLACTSTAQAQSNAYRAVRAGDVSGLELAIEGSNHAVRGETLTWSMTLFEVVGLDSLRPAAEGTIKVVSSEQPEKPVIGTTDKSGRITLSVPVPTDATDNMGVMVRADTKSGVTRTFELNVRTTSPRKLWVSIPNPHPVAEQPLDVLGRLSHQGLAVGQTKVEVRLFDSRGPISRFKTIQTNSEGIYHLRFATPKDVEGFIRVEARTPALAGHDQFVQAAAQRSLTPIAHSSLMVHVKPEKWLVKAGERIEIEVLVRRPDGRPVQLAVLQHPRTIRSSDRIELRTDARGRATFVWQAPRRTVSQFQDHGIRVSAERTGIGSGSANTTVRVAGAKYTTAISVENGGLHPKIKGRVFARVVNIDGSAAGSGIEVELSGPRLKKQVVITDTSGVAVFETSLLKQAKSDRCGGEVSTLAKIMVDDEARSTREVCLNIDPDVSVKPRVAGKSNAGQPLVVSLSRTPEARNYPVSVSLMRRRHGALEVLATKVVGANKKTAKLELPDSLRGVVFVRARTLVGKSTQESRGSLTATWVTGSDAFVLDGWLKSGQQSLNAQYTFTGGNDRTTFAIGLPVDSARQLKEEWESRAQQSLGDIRSSISAASADLLTAALNRLVFNDLGASAVLDGRQLVEAPAPQNPLAYGLLRDPWRSKARFVSGRLALMFRAIENFVDQSVPNDTEQVAFEEKGKMKFNAQVLTALQAGNQLGAEGATGLGGDPLTIAKIRKMDSNFNYDNVAKRVTRRRLFRLMLALRQLVRDRALDLDWARLGDPSLWLSQLAGTYVGDGAIQARDLADAWGRPFKLVKTAKPRFSRLTPVSGFELISMGPDGREKTADDIWDPTARVLPSKSLYAKAVKEDALVARLNAVELGRATVQTGAGFFGAHSPGIRPPRERSAVTGLWTLPKRLHRDHYALGLRRPTLPAEPAAAMLRSESPQLNIDLKVDSEPRTWGVVALGFSQSGINGVSLREERAGSDFLIVTDWPNRLRIGETLSVPVHVTNTISKSRRVSLNTKSAHSDGDLSGSTDVLLKATDVSIPAGESSMFVAAVTAKGEGEDRVTVSAESNQQEFWSRDFDVSADSGRHPIRRLATGLVEGTLSTNLGKVRGTQSRVVILTPKTLSLDPDLVDVRLSDPALIAWSQTMNGLPVSPGLRADLLRKRKNNQVQGDFPALSTALASVVWASSDDDVELQAFRSLSNSLGGAYPDSDNVAGMTRASPKSTEYWILPPLKQTTGLR